MKDINGEERPTSLVFLMNQEASTPSPNRVRPTLPASFFKFPVRARLKAVQQYISSFEYKHGPQTSFNSHKARPLARIMDTAKMMIYNPQPIKCIEAVFLALYLTAGVIEVERIPLGFKSELHGKVYQHIVLLVKYQGKFGAFGISRQHDLMNKDFQFESISSIVEDYTKAYEQSHHRILRIRVGLPVEHNVESFNFICWRYLSLDPSLLDWHQCSEELERHAGQAKKLWERWLLDGQRVNKKADIFPKQIGKLINNIPRKECACNEQDLGLKMVKRQQTLGGEQASSLMAVKRRQPLRRICSSKIESNPLSKSYQYMVPSIKQATRELHVPARQCFGCQSIAQEVISLSSSLLVKKSSRKMCLKFLSLELLSDSCDTKRPKFSVHQPKKSRKRCAVDRVLRCIHSPGISMKVVAGEQQLQGVFGTRYS